MAGDTGALTGDRRGSAVVIAGSAAAADILRQALADSGLDALAVSEEASLLEACGPRAWELAVVAEGPPGLDAARVLELLPGVPLIAVAGPIGEDAVAALLRAGAADYCSWAMISTLGELATRCLERASARAAREVSACGREETAAEIRSLIDNAPFPISLRGLDGRFQLLNRRCAELIGRAPEDMLGLTATELFSAETGAAIEAQVRAVGMSGEATAYELAGSLPDGVTREYLVSDYPVRDEHGQIIGVGAISLDISARKRTEALLREAEDRFRGAFDSAAIGMALVRPDGRFIQVNPALCGMLGFTEEELLDVGFQEITHPEDLDDDEDLVRAVLAGEIDTYELDKRYLRKDGSLVWSHLNVSLVRDANGKPVHFVSQIKDISQLKHAEELDEQLRHSQRLDAVGRLAGGVAHDFNNMLTAIKGYSELLVEGLDARDPLRSHADQICRAAEQAAALPRQLLAFSRKQVSEPRVIDINDAVRASGDMLSHLIDERIALIIEPRAQRARVLADPGQIEQVLVNLAVNAGEAMPDAGTLTLSTRDEYLGRAAAAEHGASAGPHVVLYVADEGVGMDAETKSKIFEPFYTTKATGSGLGLATVYGIVRQTGGFLRVESHPGAGSVFEVWLPRSSVEATEGPRELRRPPPAAALGTVLLAEDERAVRDLTVTVLERAGYDVLPSGSGEEASAILAEHGGSVDVLVADMVMPGMSGRELAEHVLAVNPLTRVVLMSGYTPDAPVIGAQGQHRPAFLQKPFSPRALVESVAKRPPLAGAAAAREGSRDRRVKPTTCLVADDHPAVLDSVSRYLSEHGFDVLARAEGGEEAIAQIALERPTIALLDVRMEPLGGIEVARRAALIAPETRIVLFTGYGDCAMLEQAMDAGVRAFVLKEAPLAELLRALEIVIDGGTYVDAELARALASPPAVAELSPLTPREQEVLALIADGLTNERAAAALGISAETVQSHVRNAMAKLDADSRTQAVATALRRSLLV